MIQVLLVFDICSPLLVPQDFPILLLVVQNFVHFGRYTFADIVEGFELWFYSNKQDV